MTKRLLRYIRDRSTAATLLVAVAFSLGACASSNSSSSTSRNDLERAYAADLDQVERAVVKAARMFELGMTAVQTMGNGTQRVTLYKKRSVRGVSSDVRTATFEVVFEQDGSRGTRVRVTIPKKIGGGGSYGTSRGQSQQTARRYAERILQRLDKELPSA